MNKTSTSTRITIRDMAKELGVSTTTITRALNSKGRISDETKRLVSEAAMRMGYKPNRAAGSLARKTVNIATIINSKIPVHHNEMIKGINAAQGELADFNVKSEIFVYTHENSRLDVLKKMKDIGDSGIDGIIISPGIDTRDYITIIEELHYKGIPVVTVVEDIPGSRRVFNVRNSGRLAGKMAAELLWWFTNEKHVAIFTAHKDQGIHKEKIDGFLEQMQKKPLKVLAIYEHHDDSDIADLMADKLFREYPEIEGVYIATANSATICEKICERGFAGKVKVIASDIFPELNEYISKGVVHATIYQNPFEQGKMAFKYIYEHIVEGQKFEPEILLKPQIVLECNLEEF